MTKVVFLDAGTLPQGLAFDPSSGIRYMPHETTAPDLVGDHLSLIHI